MNKAIFIDKDGTLIPNLPYNVDTSKITFMDGAIEALQQWKQQGYLIVIISNQAGIARNYFTEEDIDKVKYYLADQLALHGISLDGFYYCPHHPQGTHKTFAIACDCRKPAPGMILRAATDLDIDVNQSWMIGDVLNDVEAGNSAGCRTILIDSGTETEWLPGSLRTADFKADNLKQAADFISIERDK